MANEKRLIDANALQFEPDPWGGMNGVICVGRSGGKTMATVQAVLKRMIDNAPTVDAVEVVHARWLYDSGSGKYFCSACDENALSFKKDTLYGGDLYEVCLTDYCPNCGAKMDGGDGE